MARVEVQAASDGLTVRFVGIYHYGDVTIFVDFDPVDLRPAQGQQLSGARRTNDLFQAQTLGQFSRVDRNGNRLTSVRADQFADYLRGGYKPKQPRVDVFHRSTPSS